MHRRKFIVAATAGLIWARSAHAETLSGAPLLSALRQGGFVLVMRHAQSPRTKPDQASANPDNVGMERQLDDVGRTTARAMGEAMRQLRIPLGEILSSPTYRAMETIAQAGLGKPKAVDELGDGGQAMTAGTDTMRADWLRKHAAEAPRSGTNTIMITHSPNITGAFASAAAGIAEGETLVMRPDGKGQAEVVARIKITEWQQ
ncbi:MAG: hypothetical protein EXR11_06780 [Rhodospirillaceae bacterium]|nr:hypothetical protein [Rhodospirillaceae bacterium]